ncbi:MAG: MazG family protein [Kineosporiaceae bacterium]
MSGQALLRVVEVVDRLVSPGGCPWDAEQTHESLAPYLVEETYEAVDAVAGAGTPAGDAELADELGDVLLQVVFHARVAAGRGAFDVDDVARRLVDKLVRRHPHVFGDGEERIRVADAAEVQANWDRLKAAEAPGRGPFDGIPAALPALARAQKVLGRLERAGLDRPAPPPGGPRDAAEAVGASLLGLVAAARERGVDAEQALRAHLAALEARHAGAGAGHDAGPGRAADAPGPH